MSTGTVFFHYGVALFIGILVGLQREFSFGTGTSTRHSAGMRTFALLGLSGAAAAHLSQIFNSPIPFACIVIVAGAFLAVSYFIDARDGETGITTRVAAALTLFVGALAFTGPVAVAVAVAVTMVALLAFKSQMHSFAKQLSNEDVVAVIKFAIITAIVLPVLPNHNYGPGEFALFNPFKIWLLVVLISAISFVGYVLIKLTGAGKGIGLTGFFGGLVSSTAVTLSFTERSRVAPELSRRFAFAIIVAWTVMYVRVIGIVAVVNVTLAKMIWLPLGASALAGLFFCAFMLKSERKSDHADNVVFVNPFELGPAIKFGLLFTIILAVSKVAQVYLGTAGVYLSSFVAGLADVDAIALSVAKLAVGETGLIVAARAIVIAAVANTILKGGFALATGAPALKRAMLPGVVLMLVVGCAALFLIH